MKLQYTHGPWQADYNVHNLPIGICSVDGRHVTDVKSYGEAPDTDKANARLIAAAPELLQALIQCRAALNHHGITGDPASFMADNAIAKAVQSC